MSQVLTNYKRELIDEIEDLPDEKTKEVLEFICFIKHKEVLSKIDPTQAYFWTPKWQEMEEDADEDIKVGRLHHYNSVEEFKAKMESR
ncbi:MAG: hypothetical protein QME81_10075 [bacterium]|nr:hypothetical protein [bacterium]